MKELQFKQSFDARGRVIYQAGDAVGVRGSKVNPLCWLSANAITPKTPLYHFLIIGDYIESEDDYVILESIAKGTAVGRLSWYKNREYVVFRVNDPDAEYLGQQAAEKASIYGRRHYDYGLFLKLAVFGLGYALKEIATLHIPPRPLSPDRIPYRRDSDFICSELVFETWRLVGIRLRAEGHAPVPAEVILAVERGDLVVIDQHDGKPANWRAPDKSGLRDKALEIAQAKVEKAGPWLIGRQGGQKRNRVHVYPQPFGYPIRLCDWNAVEEKSIEVLAKTDIMPSRTRALGIFETAVRLADHITEKPTGCSHCRAVLEGKRGPAMIEFEGERGA